MGKPLHRLFSGRLVDHGRTEDYVGCVDRQIRTPFEGLDDAAAFRAAVAKLDDLCDAEHRHSLPGDPLEKLVELAKQAFGYRPN